MNGSHVNGFAQVAETTGFAIMGALSGLYVAALMAKIDIEEINSVGVLLLVTRYGSVGLYLETSLSSLPSGVSHRVLSDSVRENLFALASATCTLIAALAARVSVYMIVLDESLPIIWNVAIGFWWILGVLLLLAAGTAARLDSPQVPLVKRAPTRSAYREAG